MAEIIGHIGRAQTLTAELSTPQTITGSLCGGAAHGIPTGGTPGQALIKASTADYATRWMSILPEDTASGSVASFPDGADDLPMGVVVDIDPVQDLNGYDNPWPGGGGANKWDGEWASGEISSSTGNESPSESSNYWYSVNYVPISDSNTYYIAGEASGKAIRVRFYDANKGYIGYAVASGQAYCGSTFVPPSGAAYMRFAPEKANFPNHSIAINYPSTVTTVTPYSNICPISGRTGAKIYHSGADTSNPTEYEIPFSTEVYGGTLNVETGELVVTKAYAVLDATRYWIKSSSFPGGYYTTRDFPSGIGKAITPFICSHAKTATTQSSYLRGTCYCDNSFNFRLMGEDSTLQDWLDYIESQANAGTPIQICYTLTTPITLTLTPVEIRSLFGDNNVFADTGDVSVTYKADIQKYIDKKISAAVAAMS